MNFSVSFPVYIWYNRDYKLISKDRGAFLKSNCQDYDRVRGMAAKGKNAEGPGTVSRLPGVIVKNNNTVIERWSAVKTANSIHFSPSGLWPSGLLCFPESVTFCNFIAGIFTGFFYYI